MKLPDAIDTIRPSVVQFSVTPSGARERQQFGSGFILDQEGHIATAAHVIQDADRYTKAGHAITLGLAYPNFDSGDFAGAEGLAMQNCFHLIGATLLAIDIPNDVALLKMNPNPFESPPRSMLQIGDTPGPIPLYKECATSTDRPRDGEYIAVSGYPLNSPTLVTTAGNLASSWATVDRRDPDGAKRPDSGSNVYLADVSVNPGNSGGPTYRINDGCVIGVCTAYQHAPLMFADEEDGQAKIDGRPVGINSGLGVVTPIEHVLALIDAA